MDRVVDFFKNNRKNIINVIILIVFLFIVGVSLWTHELWRDEAQSYLIARDLSFIGIIKQIRLDGHPFLWYFLLKVFIALGVSYEWSKIIPFILSLLSVGIFLKKSPFNAFINFMIVFGTTLVRSYSLCLLLMVLLIVIYKSRLKHSIIYGLLLFSIANTHVLLGGFVCGLILIDIWDCIHMKNRDSKKKLLISILTGVIGVFLLILQLYGGATARGFGTSFSFISLMREILEVIFKIVSFQVVKEEFVLFPIVGLIMFLMWGVCNKEFKIIFMVVCGLFFQLLVFIFVYPPNFYMGILFNKVL